MNTMLEKSIGTGINLSVATLPQLKKVSRRLQPKLSEEAIVFASECHEGIGQRICDSLQMSKGNLLLSAFPNGETQIEIRESVRDKHAFVVATIANSVNETLIETVLLVQALKLADAKRITVVLPYFPYSRQDRKMDERPPISARAVTDMLKCVGAHQLVTIDLHATQVEGFFDGPFENLSGLNQLVAPVVAAEGSDLIVVSPDAGGAKRAEKFARRIESMSNTFVPLVVMSKFRPGPALPPIVTLSCGTELLSGKTCILVDDMIDTGGSIVAAAEALKQKGAARVIVCASHPVFSNNAVCRLRDAQTANGSKSIDRMYVTDTLAIKERDSDFIKVISVAPLIAEAIVRLDTPRGTLRELRERTDLGIDVDFGVESNMQTNTVIQ